MKKVVILGGGYGGIKILNNLIEKKIPDDVEITLIDRNPYHSLKTEFYALAAGTLSDKQIRRTFPVHPQVQYVFSEVTKIDVEKQQIILSDEKDVAYDYLVIGLGCEDHYHDVQGAQENSYSIQTASKSREAALALGNVKAYGTVTIIGAGLSGIEIAGELRESREDLNIRLLDRGNAVLRPFNPKIQQYVEKWFAENDVDVIHGAHVEYLEPGAVCNSGQCIPSDVTIWTAGVRPNYLVRELPFEKDKQEKIVVNEYFQVPNQQNVFVVGDVASSTFSPSGQLAEHQGEQIAHTLFAILTGRELPKPSPIKLRGTLGSLGKNDGFGSIFDLPFTGLIPRIAKTGVLWLHKRHL